MTTNNFDRMVDAADLVQRRCDYIKELLSYFNATVDAISDKANLFLSLNEEDYDFTYYSDLEVDVETKSITKDLSKSNSKLQQAIPNLLEIGNELADVWDMLEKHDTSILL